MKHWNRKLGRDVDDPKLDLFLADLWNVCEKHGLAIGHEDAHGGFEIVSIDNHYKDWLFAAHDCREQAEFGKSAGIRKEEGPPKRA